MHWLEPFKFKVQVQDFIFSDFFFNIKIYLFVNVCVSQTLKIQLVQVACFGSACFMYYLSVTGTQYLMIAASLISLQGSHACSYHRQCCCICSCPSHSRRISTAVCFRYCVKYKITRSSERYLAFCGFILRTNEAKKKGKNLFSFESTYCSSIFSEEN